MEGGRDGVPQSCSSMLSIPSGEVLKFGRRRGLDLKREAMAKIILLQIPATSDFVNRSRAIEMAVFFSFFWDGRG